MLSRRDTHKVKMVHTPKQTIQMNCKKSLKKFGGKKRKAYRVYLYISDHKEIKLETNIQNQEK